MEEELAVGGYKPLSSEIASYKREEYDRTNSSAILKYEANDLLADYQGNYKKIVELSHFLADKVGIIKSALRVYVTFTAGEIRLDGGTKKNKAFFEKFIKQVKLNKVLRQSVQDFYKAGNFVWFREKDESGKTVWIHQLSPRDVDIRGHKMDRPIAKVKLNTTDKETIPRGLTKDAMNDGLYTLPILQTYQCANDREGYSRYGKTILTSTFEPVQHMEELMDMEKQSMKEVVEFLIIFTLGDKDRPAGDKQIKALSEKVRTLKSTSRLVGNHTLKADAIRPDLAVFNPQKYEVPMKLLLQSLGITPSIFTGEGSYATATAGMTSAKQAMETARQEIIDTLTTLFEDIAKENGLDPEKNPTVNLGKLNLNDEKIQHAIIRDLYLDGIISAETYAEMSGYVLEDEQKEIEEERKKYKIEPRQMSSTMTSNEGGRPDEDGNSNKPNQDKKPSTDK
ncbi:hypothetical protein [Microcystis phage MaeS]|nr:hypothetical protein [Microcystis phage MaeS]